MTRASDTSSSFKTTGREPMRYAKLVKNQRDSKGWTPISCCLRRHKRFPTQRPVSANAQTTETWAAPTTGRHGRASQTTNTNEYNTGGEQYGN